MRRVVIVVDNNSSMVHAMQIHLCAWWCSSEAASPVGERRQPKTSEAKSEPQAGKVLTTKRRWQMYSVHAPFLSLSTHEVCTLTLSLLAVTLPGKQPRSHTATNDLVQSEIQANQKTKTTCKQPHQHTRTRSRHPIESRNSNQITILLPKKAPKKIIANFPLNCSLAPSPINPSRKQSSFIPSQARRMHTQHSTVQHINRPGHIRLQPHSHTYIPSSSFLPD